MRGRNLHHDLVERHWRGVDDARAGRAMRENFLWYQRTGVETDRTGRNQIAPAQREQIGRARAGADEMHGHSPSPSAIAAVAVLSPEVLPSLKKSAPRPPAARA